jgi:signal transduction histidine kinase/DNA-binding response OmpR family regulator/ligand-binding sensor domain-containing protein
MTQDTKGTMWFGVKNGAMSYNGILWNTYMAEDGIEVSMVRRICAADNDNIYVGSFTGISKFVNGQWTSVFSQNRTVCISKIRQFSDGQIWIVTNLGLLKIYGEKLVFYTINQYVEEIMKLDKEVEIIYLNSSPIISDELHIKDICEIDRQTLGIISKNGFFILSHHQVIHNSVSMLRIKQFKPPFWPTQMIMTKDKRIWITNQNIDLPIYVYNLETHESEYILLSDYGGSNINLSITQTKDGAIWIGGFCTLHHYNKGRWSVLEWPKVPIPQDHLYVFESQDGSVWVGGVNNDVYRIDYANDRWTQYQGLNYQCDTSDGKQWFVSVNGGVVCKDGDTWCSYSIEDGLMERPFTLLYTRSGELWASGSHFGEASVAYLKKDMWIRTVYKGHWCFDYRAAFEASDGSLWFGFGSNAGKGGIVYKNQNKEKKIKRTGTPFGNNYKHMHFVYGIGETKKHSLLFATLMNISVYDGNQWDIITEPTDLYGVTSEVLCSTPTGHVWIGTRGLGLFHYSPDQVWTQYNSVDGLENNSITSILIESDSSLWVATDKDICFFDGQRFTSSVFPSALNINREGGSLKKSNDGAIWINHSYRSWYLLSNSTFKSSDELFDNFRAFRYQPDRNPPETWISTYDTSIAFSGNTMISWKGHDKWEVTPNNELSFSWRLNGCKWSSFSEKFYTTYLNLKDGRYTFEVRARDKDFNIDLTPAKIEFTVVPPLWKRSWFLSIIAVVVLLIGFYEYRILKRDKLLCKLNKNLVKETEERVQIERKLNEMKLRFFTNISHDLRTPLTLILSILRKISSKGMTERYLNILKRNAKTLLRLVNQLLDLRKIEFAQMKLELAYADMVQFLKEIVAEFHEKDDQRKICFYSDVTCLMMSFDPDKLHKIMHNLISNAFKFTPQKGKIFVEISRHTNNKPVNRSSSTQYIEISVRDTGVGIPFQELPKLFDRFYQVNKSGNNGTGIGLSLTKELVELHGGQISVESEYPDRGTIFHVYLPFTLIKTVDKAEYRNPFIMEEKKSEQSFENLECETKREMILLVEDNSDLRQMIGEDLENDYKILEAKNGLEGFEIASIKIPDLIIADIMMPVMDGIDLSKKIKKDERTSHIPVILLTARASEEHKIEGFQTGIDDYITKPFSMDILKVRIHNLLESRKKLRDKFSHNIMFGNQEISNDMNPIDVQFINRVIQIIEENITNFDFDVIQLADKVKMDRTYLYRKFKNLIGQSPSELIRNIRLKHAAQLLAQGNFSISEITYRVGFNHPSHFARCFRNEFGQSPSEYTTKIQKEDHTGNNNSM